MMKGLEYEASLKDMGPFNLEKKRLWGISSMCINRRWGIKERKRGSVQWCPVTGSEAVSTN